MQPISTYSVGEENHRGVVYFLNRGGCYFTPFEYKGKRRFKYWVKTSCASCNKTVFKCKSNSKRYSRAYCSKACKKINVSGPNSPFWSGGRRVKHSGHILVYQPEHPRAVARYVPEHRLIVEQDLGRILRKEEFVHHIDCSKTNNRLDNLVVVSNWQHNKAHASLEHCVSDLIRLGVLRFNRELLCYEVVRSPCQ
jgi:hypothetical protein